MSSTLSVAVRLPNWLGDAVMARSALVSMRETFADAELLVFARSPATQLVALSGVEADVEELSAGDGRRATMRTVVESLRARRVDVGLVLPPSFSSALGFWLGGATERVGFAEDRRRALLTRAVSRGVRGERHLAEEYLELVSAAAQAVDREPVPVSSLPLLKAAPEAAARAYSRLEGLSSPLLALAPGAVYGPTKRWPATSYATLAERFVAETGGSVVVTGAASDEEVTRDVVARAVVPTMNLSGKTDLDELIAVFERADVVVSNDSGAMHVAAATGTPMVALFGSTNPAWTGPQGPSVTIVSKDEPCAPCYQSSCDIGIVCLTRIDVDEVWAAVRNSLGGA